MQTLRTHDHADGYDTPTAILRARCQCGLMMTIMVGAAYSILLHPQHQAQIARVAATGQDETFQDDAGRSWTASLEELDVVLRDADMGMVLAIPVEEIVNGD